MSHETGLTGAAILVLLVVSAFLAAARAALAEASRTRLGELKKRGIKGAATALALRDEGEKTETTLAFGKMLVAALAGASAYLLLRGLEPPVAVIAALGLAALFGFLGLLLPRAYARKRADRMAVALAAPTVAAVTVLAPPATLLETLATAVMRLARVNGGEGSHTVHEDLRETIDLHAKEGTVFKNDRDMLSGILAIQDLTIADIMVHRTKMTTIDGSEPPGEIVAKVLKSGHTRIPVWNGSPDNIIGVLHAKNLFAALQKHGGDES